MAWLPLQVAYHHCIGVGKFYVYDDSSSPPLLHGIQDWVVGGIVEYKYVHYGMPAQLWAYNDCLSRHRDLHTWIMGLDVDEFVILNNPAAGTQLLSEFLKPYESYGGVAV